MTLRNCWSSTKKTESFLLKSHQGVIVCQRKEDKTKEEKMLLLFLEPFFFIRIFFFMLSKPWLYNFCFHLQTCRQHFPPLQFFYYYTCHMSVVFWDWRCLTCLLVLRHMLNHPKLKDFSIWKIHNKLVRLKYKVWN